MNGSHAFSPQLTIFIDQTFAFTLADDARLPAATPRFYLEVGSAYPGDIVGAVSCTASPTANTTGPHATHFLTESCAAGPFDTQFHEEGLPNAVRLSLRKFAYQSQDFVYLACTVRRCLQEPCGVCGGGRRLREAHAGEEPEVTVRAQVRLQNDEQATVLPSAPAPSPIAEVSPSATASATTAAAPSMGMSTDLAIPETSCCRDGRSLICLAIFVSVYSYLVST